MHASLVDTVADDAAASGRARSETLPPAGPGTDSTATKISDVEPTRGSCTASMPPAARVDGSTGWATSKQVRNGLDTGGNGFATSASGCATGANVFRIDEIAIKPNEHL